MLSPQVWGASRQPSLHDLIALRPSPPCNRHRPATLTLLGLQWFPISPARLCSQNRHPSARRGSRQQRSFLAPTTHTGSRAQTCSSFLRDTYDRSPTVSRCYCMNTGSKGGARELYDLKRFHPETTPMRTASITRIGHTVIPKKGIGSAVGGMWLEGEETREWPAQDCLCYTSYGPFPS